MAKNDDFLSLTIRDVELQWPRLDQPYRYDNSKKETEACAPTAQNAAYSVAFDVPLAVAKDLKEVLMKHYKATQSRNPKLPNSDKVFGAKLSDDGKSVRFTAKKTAVDKSGVVKKAPQVVDMALRPLEDKAIWSGSVGSVSVSAFATIDPDGVGGISLGLNSVQVKKAAYGGDGLEKAFGPAVVDEELQAFATAATPAAAYTPPPPPAASTVPVDAAF